MVQLELVVQGQHAKRKSADGVSDYDGTFSPAASGFLTNLSLASQIDMFSDHLDFSQPFVQEELSTIPYLRLWSH